MSRTCRLTGRALGAVVLSTLLYAGCLPGASGDPAAAAAVPAAPLTGTPRNSSATPPPGRPAAAGVQVPPAASISSVQARDGVLNGVLTVRAGKDSATVDAASLKARVGGRGYPVTVTPAAQRRRATMLVVDTSGSMAESGMTAVRQSVAAFLRDAPSDVLVGLVSFAGTAGVDVPLTTDRARVQQAVDGLRSQGETTLYDAVSTAVGALGTSGDRSLLLLSDGGDTRSVTATRASATEALHRAGVRAEIIGFRTAESDNAVLAGFAAAGGGQVAAAGNSAAVRAAFEAAAKALDSQVAFSVRLPALRARQSLELTGSANGMPFTATVSVDLGAAAPAPATPTVTEGTPPAPPVAAGPAPPAGPPSAAQHGIRGLLLVALVGTFLGLLGIGLALSAPAFRSQRHKRMETIERYVTAGTTVPAAKTGSVTPSAITTSLVRIGDRVMHGRESTSKTMALIERADLPLRAGEWWVLRIVALVVGLAVATVLFRGGVGMTLVAVVLGVGMGAVAPSLTLRFLAARRSKKFETQLPDVLTLVASSLSTGFSLLQALDAVARDAAQPAAKEFSRALAETRIGSDIGDALERVGARMDSTNMAWASMAIRIQRQVGGNLAETLKTTASTLRDRESLKRHVRALSAEGRLSAYILIALPIGIFLYTMQVNRSYVELLWTRPVGLAMLVGGLVSLGIGIAWMRKVVDVQV